MLLAVSMLAWASAPLAVIGLETLTTAIVAATAIVSFKLIHPTLRVAIAQSHRVQAWDERGRALRIEVI